MRASARPRPRSKSSSSGAAASKRRSRTRASPSGSSGGASSKRRKSWPSSRRTGPTWPTIWPWPDTSSRSCRWTRPASTGGPKSMGPRPRPPRGGGALPPDPPRDRRAGARAPPGAGQPGSQAARRAPRNDRDLGGKNRQRRGAHRRSRTAQGKRRGQDERPAGRSPAGRGGKRPDGGAHRRARRPRGRPRGPDRGPRNRPWPAARAGSRRSGKSLDAAEANLTPACGPSTKATRTPGWAGRSARPRSIATWSTSRRPAGRSSKKPSRK